MLEYILQLIKSDNLQHGSIGIFLLISLVVVINLILKIVTEKKLDHFITKRNKRNDNLEAQFESASYELINALTKVNSKIWYIRELRKSKGISYYGTLKPEQIFDMYNSICDLFLVLDETDSLYKKTLWTNRKMHKNFHRVHNDLRKSFSSKIIFDLKSNPTVTYDTLLYDSCLIVKQCDCKNTSGIKINTFKEYIEQTEGRNSLINFLLAIQGKRMQGKIIVNGDTLAEDAFLKLKIIQFYLCYYLEILDPKFQSHRRINYLSFDEDEISRIKNLFDISVIYEDVFEYRKEFNCPKIYSELLNDFSYWKLFYRSCKNKITIKARDTFFYKYSNKIYCKNKRKSSLGVKIR